MPRVKIVDTPKFSNSGPGPQGEINLNLPRYEEPKGFFTGYGFSQNIAPGVNMHGLGAHGERKISDRIKLTGDINSPSIFYPGGSQMFMNPSVNVGVKYRFEDGGEPCPPGQVRVNGVCVSIYSDVYKKAYAEGLVGFGAASNPQYATESRIKNLPKLTVVSKRRDYKSLKRDQDWFDNHANWSQTYDEKGNRNEKWDEYVRKMVLTGRFGVNPKTGELIKLPQSEWTNVPEEYKEMASADWGKTSIPDRLASKTAAGKRFRKNVVAESMKDVFRNPITYAPGAIFFGGLAAPAVTGALGATGAALNAPILGTVGTEYGLGALTTGNLLNLAGGMYGANQLANPNSMTRQAISQAYDNPTALNIANAAALGGLDLAGVFTSPGMGGLMRSTAALPNYLKNAYNTVATGESVLPVAWKSSAVNLSQSASDDMFRTLLNSDKLSDADRALIVEYQHQSSPFTGRFGNVNQEKRDALNNIIKKYNLNVGNNVIATRRFNPTNQSLGATLEGNRLNFGDRPTSFSAGVGTEGYGSGAVNRIVIPNRYLKGMGDRFIANQYTPLSEDALKLLEQSGARNFGSAIGTSNQSINAERELIGTGLDFRRIGKVKNDIGGYDWIVKPRSSKPTFSFNNRSGIIGNNASSSNSNTQNMLINLDDNFRNRISTSSNTIIDRGAEILNDLKSPEGVKRLKNQFKLADPSLNEQQLDDLVTKRHNEIADALFYNQPRFLLSREQAGALRENELDDYFPILNAHFSSANPYANVARTTSANAVNPRKPYSKFLNSDYSPGSISLGYGLEENPIVLDHEIGHAIQKGGVMPVDVELQQLIRSKNPFDKIFEKFLGSQTAADRKYFRTADGRKYINEAYPYLVEQRRKMVDRGILSNRYDEVTPWKLLKTRLAAFGNKKSNFEEGDRLIKFTPFWKYKKLADIMNTAPAVVPAVGAGAVGYELMNNDEMKHEGQSHTMQQKYGGTPQFEPGGPTGCKQGEVYDVVQKRCVPYITGLMQLNADMPYNATTNPIGFINNNSSTNLLGSARPSAAQQMGMATVPGQYGRGSVDYSMGANPLTVAKQQKQYRDIKSEREYQKERSKQTSVGPARKKNKIEEERDQRLKEEFVATHPGYSELDEQGNIVPTQVDRDVAGNPYPGSRAYYTDRGLNTFAEAMDYASLVTGAGGAGKVAFLAAKPLFKKALSTAARSIKPYTTVARQYGKDFIETSVAAGRPKLPTYQTAYRWQADVIPEGLKEQGLRLTPQQKGLTASWYTYKPEQVPFYMRTRPGPGNVNMIRLSDTKIKGLEGSMPDYAKGMSGKTLTTTADDHMIGELVVPENLRMNPKTMRFDLNPADYPIDPKLIKGAEPGSPLYKAGWEKNIENITLPMFESTQQNILGIPRKYFPFKKGGSVLKSPLMQYYYNKTSRI